MQKIYSLFLFIIYTGAGKMASAQNVGIGTNTPAEKLHVAGNIKADTLKPNALIISNKAGEGKILTSDAAGNASWQAREVSATGTVGFGSWGDCTMNGISEYNPVTDTAVAPSDGLGSTVAMSGNFAIVGMKVVGAGTPRKGYADIYKFNGTNWVFLQRLSDPNGVVGDFFGIGVAISGDFAIVGSLIDPTLSNSSPRQGAAFIYHYNGSSWVLTQRITDPGGLANDNFGSSVALSGDNVIVGARSDDIGTQTDQGSACIFHYDGANWVFVQKIFDASGASGDNFGVGVAISDNFVFAGAASDDIGSNANQGSFSVYRFNGTNWTFMAQITDATGNAGESLGAAISISGNYAAVTAFGATAAAGNDPGAVLIYKFNGTSWALMQELTHVSNGNAGTLFGNAVSISGDYLIAGAEFQGPNTKSLAIIYSRIGLNWQLLQSIADPQGGFNDLFGAGVALDSNTSRFLIGAPGYAFSSGKVVFGKF